jgi:hypothetical protein
MYKELDKPLKYKFGLVFGTYQKRAQNQGIIGVSKNSHFWDFLKFLFFCRKVSFNIRLEF